MTYPTLINLNLHECTQELRNYPSTINLYRCVRNCNTLNKLSNRVCVPNKTEDFNLSIFNIVTRIHGFITCHANVNVSLMIEKII